MRAMILAAGLGTRLQPLTNDKPKALVELHGTTMLELVVRKLKSAGVERIIINLHHFADQIRRFITSRDNFGLQFEFSYEPRILGTGGGLLNAAHFFDGDEPFFLHNVDVLSEVALEDLLQFHKTHRASATMVVQKRSTRRYIVADEKHVFRGRYPENPDEGAPKNLTRYAFNGIHAISPEFFSKIEERPPFSIIDSYIRLSRLGEKVLCYDMGDAPWWDLGKHESLQDAQRSIASRDIQ